MCRNGRALSALAALLLVGGAAQAAAGTFYSQGNLAADSLASWNSERDGSGSQPLDFASSDTFVAQSGHALITTAPWSLSGSGSELWLESGASIDASQPVTLDPASTLRLDASATYIHDNLSPFATTIFQAGTIQLDPSSTVVLKSSDPTGPAGVTLGNLTLDFASNPGASVTLPSGTTAVLGSLSLSAGTLALDPAGILDVAGNWTRSSGSLQANGGLARLDGAGDQTITCSGAAFDRLRVEKSGGRVLLADDLTVADSLILSGGNIETGANRVVINGSGTLSRSSGQVVGRLEKSVAAGAGNQSFEIGDATHFTPVTISGASFSSGFHVTASTAAGDRSGLAASGIDPARSVNRVYTLESSDYAGGAFDLGFVFDPADVDAGAQPPGFVVREFNGAWSAPAVQDRQSTSIAATGLAGFGDFSIGEQGIDHYQVTASSPQDRGATFSAGVTALDALGQPVSADTTTQVTMSSDGSVEYDADGNASFGDSVKTLFHGSFSIATRDMVAQTVTLLAGDGAGHTGSRGGLAILAPLEILTASLPNAVAGHAYSQSATAAGGLAPYTWSLDSGALPLGLSLSAAGVISGTSTAAGASGFTLRASDAASHSATRALSIVVTADTAFSLQFAVQPSNALVAAPIAPPVQVRVRDAFANPISGAPVSLTLEGSGTLGGGATAATDSAGLVTFSALTVSQPGVKQLLASTGALTPVPSDSFQIGCPAIAIAPDSLSGATRFVAYRDSVTASGGGSPYTYSLSAGALPTGLALNPPSGVISGTPGVFGTFHFTILATDAAGCARSRAYTLEVGSGCPAIAVLPATLSDGSLTVAYSQTISASGGHAPYAFSLTAGSLPAGLTLAAGGLLSGTPTVADSALFTVTATDSNGCAGSRAYALVIHALPAAVTNLAAQQTLTGNDNDGTVRIQVTFTMPPGATSAEVYRAGFGHYPQYDDAGGTVPAIPSYPPSSPWTLTSVTASGQFDEPATRDFYYYVVFVKNAGGGRSAVSNRSNGALNYHLGDVSNGITAGAGNNRVGDEDISLLGAHYGITEPAISAAGVAYLDVGPTTDLQVTSRPFTDHRIDFEDLIVFATNYQAVSGPALLARAGRAAPLGIVGAAPAAAPSAGENFQIEAPALVDAGSTFGVTLSLQAGGRVQGFSARLAWNSAVVEPVGYESGGFVESQGGVLLSPAAGTIDAALLGSRERGLSGSGAVAAVKFRALRAGDPGLRIASVLARDRFNRDVVTQEKATVLRPTRTELMAAAPNPARGRTQLEFTLSDPGAVELAIFGVDGRRVRTLAKGMREPGVYREIWDGSDDSGRGVAPGIYYVHLVAGGRRFVKSLAYLR